MKGGWQERKDEKINRNIIKIKESGIKQFWGLIPIQKKKPHAFFSDWYSFYNWNTALGKRRFGSRLFSK